MRVADGASSEAIAVAIRELQRHRFGRRAKSLPESLLPPAPEEVEATETAATEKADPAARETQARGRRVNRGAPPTHLPRVETTVAKYADHLPLHRQAQVYARQGIALDRETLADGVGKAAFLLRPAQERLFDWSPTQRLRRRPILGRARP